MKKFLLGLLLVIVSVATTLLIQNFPTVKAWFTKEEVQEEQKTNIVLTTGEYDLTNALTEDNLITYPEGYEYMYSLDFNSCSLEEGVLYKLEFLDENGEDIYCVFNELITDVESLGLNGELQENEFVLMVVEDAGVGVVLTINCEFANSTDLISIDGSRIIFLVDSPEVAEALETELLPVMKTMKISVFEE